MAADVDIANMALIKLGADTIISLTEDSVNARKINAIYDFLRESVLREHQWNFAVKRAECALLAETPEFEYDYFYQTPSDSLRIISLEDNAEFRVEGGKIATNETSCLVKYISNITDPNVFDALFIDAFSTRIAAELAYSISDNLNTSNALWQEYGMKLRLAKSKSSQENTPISVKADEWLNSRY